jgi:hypothetical protein
LLGGQGSVDSWPMKQALLFCVPAVIIGLVACSSSDSGTGSSSSSGGTGSSTSGSGGLGGSTSGGGSSGGGSSSGSTSGGGSTSSTSGAAMDGGTKMDATTTSSSGNIPMACETCIMANCSAESQACGGDPACAEAATCNNACGDQMCADACAMKGGPKFAALGMCVFTKCKTQCVQMR